ncbi:MAG: response regulator [Sedimentisphaerales bacterium]|nr:response regulator [Sedimentisphaerales bacterium]
MRELLQGLLSEFCRMTLCLRDKVLLGLACVLGFYLLLQYGMQRLVITPGFEQLQQREAVENLHRCQDAIRREIYHLGTLVKDWSQWDDTCRFVKDKNEQYIQATLLDETFAGARLNLIYYYDVKGTPIWGKLYDVTNQCSIENEQIERLFTCDCDWLWRHDSLESSREGILRTDIAPLLLCSRPITNSSGDGPIQGALVMGRFLDASEIAGLSRQTRVPFTLLDMETDGVRIEKAHMDRVQTGGECLIRSDLPHRLLVRRILPDIHGRPAFLLEVDMPARILAKGRITFVFNFLSVAGAILVTLITIYLILRWAVLSRIETLCFEVDHVSHSRSLSGRIRNRGNDEIGRLEKHINAMLDRLESTHVELRESAQRLSLHFDQTPLGVIEWNKDYEILRWNPAAEKIFGYSRNEAIGRRGTDLIVPEKEQEKVFAVWKDLLENRGGTKSTNINRTKNGRMLVCEWHNTPLVDEDGNIVAVASLVHDVTREQEAAKQLEQSKILAEEANRTKSLFLANMSHEIRTPMNAILGFGDLLAEEPLTSSQLQYVETIRSSADNLLGIINDILDLSKVEAGQLKIEYEPCNLSRILTAIESLLRPRAQGKSIHFAVHRKKNVPERIVTDPLRLQQCLVNLIGNAIKFTERGHVFVRVSLEQNDPRPWLRFDIEDTGIGIAPDRLEAIFESFTQADGKTTRQFGGTGLGLTITRRLAEMMGGIVSVSSRLGEGSVFSFQIPLLAETTNDPSPENEDSSRPSEDQSQKSIPRFCGHLLVAEDVPVNQMFIRSVLERLGLTVTVVQDGRQASEIAQRESFDLIFMDMQMPVMSGYEATQILRKYRCATPIIAVTAHALKGDREKCINAGCDDYLAKPLRLEELIAICKRYLQSDSAVLEASHFD